MPAILYSQAWPRPKPRSSRPPVSTSAVAISPASTVGVCSGSVWHSVRKRMFLVRCAAAENSASGFDDWPKVGKEMVFDRHVNVVAEPVALLDVADHVPYRRRRCSTPGMQFISV